MNRHLQGIAIISLIAVLISCRSPEASDSLSSVFSETPSGSGQVTRVAPVVTSTPPTKPSSQWKLVKQLQPEHKPRYAAFMNELFGVTDCGEKIQPSFTSDGGQSWSQPVMGKFCPDSVDIVDGRNIWLCNSFGVFTSKDGGRSLLQMYNPYDGCRIMSFADEDHGWSSFDWNIAATSDGALRWVEVEKEFTMGDISALFLRTPEEGYVLTYDGILFTTTDGGETWTANDLGIVDDDMRIANMDGRPPAAMRFQDKENGIIVLALAGQGNTQFISLNTSDGGQTWEQQNVPLNLGAIYLSHDGRFLTVTELGGAGTINILENQTVMSE